MYRNVQCSCCGRLGGSPAGGAVINSIGCTGTCLCWAVETIRNPPFYEDQPQWKPWSVRAEDWSLFRQFVQMSTIWAVGIFTGILLRRRWVLTCWARIGSQWRMAAIPIV